MSHRSSAAQLLSNGAQECLKLRLHFSGVLWPLKELGKPPTRAWCDVVHLVEQQAAMWMLGEGVLTSIPPFSLDGDTMLPLVYFTMDASLSGAPRTHPQAIWLAVSLRFARHL
jgi:hypothetical protein